MNERLPNSPTRSPGRPRKEFDRATAIEQAMHLFWERGYEGTSFDDLISRMGIAASTFYTTFGSKQQLFFEAIDYYLDGPGGYFECVLSSELNTKEAIARIFEKAAIACTSSEFPRGCMISLAAIYVPPGLHEIRDEMRKRRNDLIQALIKRLVVAVQNDEIPPDTDTEGLAVFFAACFRGMSILSRDGASREQLMKIGERAMRAWPAP